MTTELNIDEQAAKYFGAPITDWERIWGVITGKYLGLPASTYDTDGYNVRGLANACLYPGIRLAHILHVLRDTGRCGDCAHEFAADCGNIIHAAYRFQPDWETAKARFIGVAREYYTLRWNRPDIDWVRLLDREGRGHLIDPTKTKPEHDPVEAAGIAIAWIASLLAQGRIRVRSGGGWELAPAKNRDAHVEGARK